MARPTLSQLRRYAVGRTLFAPTTLRKAIEKLGFVQADPIRAPARAQDLILRHRVKGYRQGDLERLYAKLPIDETFFINYGFLPHEIYALMHPRVSPRKMNVKRAQEVLAFVHERGTVHPREVDEHFQHGTVTNYWGGKSSATTHLLGRMHYGGLIRVARRENGIRIYGTVEHASERDSVDARVDALVDLVVGLYAPLPLLSLNYAVGRLRFALPQDVSAVRKGLKRARERLSHVKVDGIEWYWPADEKCDAPIDDRVRLLTPFDPIVWDRRRFELLWKWEYRFEAYTPEAKRKLGYYALPLLWRDEVIGWANVGDEVQLGFVKKRPRSAQFTRELEAELERLRAFL